ncbi:hypothetical protein BLA29_000663 [Euroglyphus maynei]|uniref:Uncharacterized protein n=1 Tax=Euroglyphus maynei TaxID=6958 RepID=A0A1Y3B3C9_EURMA|nr:hypothetical protein BLA29_000663 [Euroglyphus maynei]
MAYDVSKRKELENEMNQLLILFERIKCNKNDSNETVQYAQEMAQKIVTKIDVPINYDSQQLLDSMMVSFKEGADLDNSLMFKIRIRNHFVNLLIKQFDNCRFDQNFIDDYVLLYFPLTLNKRRAHLCSYVISVAIWLEHSKLLNSMASYVLENETIVFPQQSMPKNLAKISPKFCAALISRGYFHRHQTGKDYLADWLLTLGNDNSTDIDWKDIQLNAAVRYSILEKPDDSNLHLAILTLIQQKKCHQFTNHFIIDLSTNLSNQITEMNVANNKSNDQPFHIRDELLDHFVMFITMAMKTSLCSQSNQLKKRMIDKFNNNPLLIQIFSDLTEDNTTKPDDTNKTDDY